MAFRLEDGSAVEQAVQTRSTTSRMDWATVNGHDGSSYTNPSTKWWLCDGQQANDKQVSRASIHAAKAIATKSNTHLQQRAVVDMRLEQAGHAVHDRLLQRQQHRVVGADL